MKWTIWLVQDCIWIVLIQPKLLFGHSHFLFQFHYVQNISFICISFYITDFLQIVNAQLFLSEPLIKPLDLLL